MRKACKRREYAALPPRGLRPKLDKGQQTDLALVHLINLDAMAKGQGTPTLMWHLVEQALLWWRVSYLVGDYTAETQAQMLVATDVVRRFARTGKVGFSGTEYQAAKDAIPAMDALAETVDKATAVAAAEWAERHMQQVGWNVARAAQALGRAEGAAA